MLIVALLGLLLATSPAMAVSWGDVTGDYGVKKVFNSGMQFLKIAQSARAAAMGEAFTAVSDDINAMFFNGAGLVHVENVAYMGNYTRWLVDTDIYSMAVAWNTRSSRGEVLGLSVISHQPVRPPETTIYQPNGTGETVAVSDVQVGLLYAIKFTDKFSVSLKGNWVQETLYDQKDRGFTIDIGSYFYTGFRSLRLGMSFRNYGPDIQSADHAYLMPLVYGIGAAAEVYGEKGDPAYLTMSAESAFYIDYEQRWHFGAELWLQNAIALRGGWKYNYDLESLAVGAGFKQSVRGKDIFVDVSYSILQDDKTTGVAMFDSPIRVSVGGTF